MRTPGTLDAGSWQGMFHGLQNSPSRNVFSGNDLRRLALPTRNCATDRRGPFSSQILVRNI